MKKILFLTLLLLFAVTATAQTVVITVGPGDATYATSSGNYVSSVTFASTPVLTITASANNMDKRQTGTYLLWHSGSAGSSNYTLSAADGYFITEYSITGMANTSAQTFTAGSVSHEFAAGESSTFTVTGLKDASTTCVLTGANASGLKVTQISVTVTKPTEEQTAAYNKITQWMELLQSQALVTDASNYSSNALQPDDGDGYPALLDKNTGTYFHSQWNGTNPDTYHHLQAKLSEGVYDFYFYTYKRSQTNRNRPTEILIQGSNDGDNFSDITTINPSVAKDDYLSDKISSASVAFEYLRFVVKNTNTGDKFGNYVFFSYSEFWLLPSNESQMQPLRCSIPGNRLLT